PERIMVESLRLVVSLYSLKCECFTGETLVSTTEGDKRIDAIEVGDYVFAYDTEKQENVPAKVTYVSITETDILVHVYTSEGEEIKTTMFHPFYVKNVKNGGDEEYGMWKASANLVAGDELLAEDGRVVYVKEVRIERLAESIKVYNLEVEGLHTYYVGSGVLVHNDYAKGNDSNGNSNESGSKAVNNVSQASPFDLQATHSQTLSKKNMNKLIDDIKNNGINETIKYVEYNGQKYVVDGHHRLIASKRLGLEQVPIEQVELPYAGYKTVEDLLWFD
ncbi:MAG: ParB N-terminal domain-containing protein, partial [Lachnospiraceae bacterium]|nr:ParB N-terminal domain-containing protein [Lachnospiraceae bacterium]